MSAPCRHCGRPLAIFHGGFARCSSGPTAWDTQYEPARQSVHLYLLTCRFALTEDREWMAELTRLHHEALDRESAAGLLI